MSDEDSGPEDFLDLRGEDQVTAMRDWRVSMLERLGFNDPDDDEHDDVSILEVAHPEWRSDFVGSNHGSRLD